MGRNDVKRRVALPSVRGETLQGGPLVLKLLKYLV